MKETILIVEDDPHIAELVKYNLEKAGYEGLTAGSGEDALQVLKQKRPALIILDVMLPKMDGFELCRSIKGDSRLKGIPVIMLTAKGEEVDRIVGLELGADDYVVKPFSTRELILRVKAVMRRTPAAAVPDESRDEIRAAAILLDIARHRIFSDGKPVELTPMEFKLLRILMERRGRVQTRERLLADVWEIEADIDTRTIDTHVKRLREKLGHSGKYIETVRGLGYRFREED